MDKPRTFFFRSVSLSPARLLPCVYRTRKCSGQKRQTSSQRAHPTSHPHHIPIPIHRPSVPFGWLVVLTQTHPSTHAHPRLTLPPSDGRTASLCPLPPPFPLVCSCSCPCACVSLPPSSFVFAFVPFHCALLYCALYSLTTLE